MKKNVLITTIFYITITFVNLYIHYFFISDLLAFQIGYIASLLLYLGGIHVLLTFGADKYLLKHGKTSLNLVYTIDVILLVVYLIFVLTSYQFIDFELHFSGYIKDEVIYFLLLSSIYPFCVRLKFVRDNELKFISSRFPQFVSSILSPIIVINYFRYDPLNSYLLWKSLTFLIEGLIVVIISLGSIKYYRLTLKKYRYYLKFTIPLIVSSIFVYLTSNFDYITIKYYLNKDELGIYWFFFSMFVIILQIRKFLLSIFSPIFLNLLIIVKENW